MPTGSPLQELLAETARFLSSNESAEAIRRLDRAWRIAPSLAGFIGPTYGDQLMRSGDPRAALAALRPAFAQEPLPLTASLWVGALVLLGEHAEARQRLATALQRYCVEAAGGPLRAAARQVLQLPDSPPGWVALSPDLALHGEVTARHAGMIELRDGDNQLVARCRPRVARDGFAAFVFPKLTERATRMAVTCGGQELLGAPVPSLPDFGLEGRAESDAAGVRGWVRLGWAPHRGLDLEVQGHKATLRLATHPDPDSPSRRIFKLDLGRARSAGDPLTISARMPDGSLRALPDAPLLLPDTVRAGAPTAPRKRALSRQCSPTRRKIDVIVPVYRGRAQTLACLESVLSAKQPDGDLIVIDDASPEPQLSRDLERLARQGRIVLLKNAANRGFTASVNRGIAVHPDRDVVLLNSDTLVHGDWLARLRTACHAVRETGTATPLSNDGSIASYFPAPHACDAREARRLDRIAASANRGRTAPLPVGVGFCLYMKRECLEDTGPLDEAAFGRGYGEEVDFCMRAAARGWKHVLAADVFVMHAGGVSFGSQRTALQERNQRLLDLRYPGFQKMVDRFNEVRPLEALRARIASRELQALKGKHVLLLSLAGTGGVERFVKDRCDTLRAQGITPLLLRPLRAGDPRCVLSVVGGTVPDLIFDTGAGAGEVRELLRSLALEHVEIQHFLGLPPAIVEMARALDVPHDVYVHDYVWSCPRITLIDGTGRYCGEPALETCERCVKRNGSMLEERIGVAQLRARSRKWLSSARRVVTPSHDVANRLARYFPKVTAEVTPWQAAAPAPARFTPLRASIRVALMGGIGAHKGYRVLLDCARDSAKRRLPLEFTVIGHTENDAQLLKTGRVFITGAYAEQEAAALLRREQPHVILLASVWPETWNYTLTYALNSGLPIVAFDIGAIAERMRRFGRGVLLPMNVRPAVLNDHLIRAATNPHARS